MVMVMELYAIITGYVQFKLLPTTADAFPSFFFFFALPASEASVTSTMSRRRRPHMILRSDGELILVPVTA
jgi:hypothetical protein